MRTKRIAYPLLLLNVVFFMQCSNSRIDPEPPGPGPGPNPEGKSKVSLNILIPKSNVSTYAGVDATKLENHIEILYVDLYQGGSLIKQEDFSGPELTVLMNSNDSIVTVGYEVDNITTGTLSAKVYANSRTVRVLASTIDSVPLPKGDAATSFFMSGEIAQINYDTGSGTYKADIPLQRNVAKIRVNVSKHTAVLPSDLEIDYENIKIKTLNIADKTDVFGPAYGFTDSYIETDERTGANLHTSTSFNTTDGGQIDSFYVYENCRNSFTEATNATRVQIEIPTISPTEGSKKDKYTYSLYLPLPDGYNLKRNYIYTLDIKVRGQSLEPVITTSIQPWNDVNIDGTIHGTYLTMDKSEIVFDSNGKATINFCTDAQAIYINYEEFNKANTSNGAEIGTRILYPVGIEKPDLNLAPSDFKDGQILLDKQHCGSFGFEIKLSEYPSFPAVNFSGKICVRAGNIVKCLSFPGIRTYDAHFIVGDSIFDWNERYISATVPESWLHVSRNRLYDSGEMLQSYNGSATVLYLHLDENLTGSSRTGTVTVITEDGAEKTLNLSQLPAIPVGRFGYNSILTDDSIYGAMLYTEQLYEFKGLQYITTEDNLLISGNAIYNGRMTAIHTSVFDRPKYDSFNYQDAVYQAINYCAHKNRITSNVGNINNELLWYLPSQAQLMGMWISYSSYNGLTTSNFTNSNGNPADYFWSSTDNGGFSNYAQFMNFEFGNMGHRLRESKHWARCVRDGGAVTSMVLTTNTYPVIDFGNGNGMPAGSYTDQTKNDASGDELSPNNATLFQKLRVAIADHASGVPWDINACDGTIEGVDDWRLPTQRELQAIWILQSEINKQFSSFNLLADDYYWSATHESKETNGTNAWTIHGRRTVPGSSGNAPNQLKESKLSVRCVREQP